MVKGIARDPEIRIARMMNQRVEGWRVRRFEIALAAPVLDLLMR